MAEQIKFTHNLKIYKNGELIREINNMMVTSGKQEVVKLVGYGLGGTPFRYMAIGSDNTATTSSSTALGSEIARTEASVSTNTVNFTDDSVRFEASFTVNSSVTIEEAGIFNDATAGTMLVRALTGSLSLDSGDTINLTWDVTIQ